MLSELRQERLELGAPHGEDEWVAGDVRIECVGGGALQGNPQSPRIATRLNLPPSVLGA